MGGLGLATLSRQARADGNIEGAEKAQKLSNWLIGIMIAGLVTVSAEQAISHIPNLTKDVQQWIDAIKITVEVVLVIARAICAVFYGVIIHALKHETGQAPTAPTPATIDYVQLVQALAPILQPQLTAMRTTVIEELRDTLARQQGGTLMIEAGTAGQDSTAERDSGTVATETAGQDNAANGTATTGQKNETRQDKSAGQDSGTVTETGQGQAPSNETASQVETRDRTAERDSETGRQDNASRVRDYQAGHPEATRQDIASALGVSEKTVSRYWTAPASGTGQRDRETDPTLATVN